MKKAVRKENLPAIKTEVMMAADRDLVYISYIANGNQFGHAGIAGEW